MEADGDDRLLDFPARTERRRQRAQDAARPLEPFELCPAAVEGVGQVGVEWKAVEKTLLGGWPGPGRSVVESGEIPDYADDVRPERVGAAYDTRLEEATVQHFRHVFLLDRLHALFTLPPKHVEQIRH